ncbi:phosphate-starvation-inducible protein PsiE [Lysinibacillus endophyticus]|uniref:Phosphate-starvation-inducible protein PsiE n=1 Tax=Ureibacillus endophyticus TaxID=1978490 RepID=A0A494YSW1_9BACL|nr:phosphate-starvation-inducible protein PsiE [Lysinibacillus endophyticus]MCP1146385.1 phosphate-starvation-inducible protein PsiE [Lysinibacillus endophyticus]RKQ13221.1 phosphate-starvation-inducible protein PsiE [Lysinibacillus endophyticus]
MASNALKKDAKISPERVDEALSIRDRLIIELLVSVLDEKLVIERHILKERLANLVELADYDGELKETLHGIVAKM